MKKILFLSSNAQVSGGGQKSTLGMIERLDRAKYEPALFCYAPGPLVEKAKSLGCSILTFPLPAIRMMNIVEIYKTVKKIKQILTNENINLIHSEFSRGTFFFGLAAKQIGIPVVWHVRVNERESSVYTALLYWLSDKVVAVSSAVSKRFSTFKGNLGKVEIIYNAVDTSRLISSCDEGWLRNEMKMNDEILIGIIGAISPSKGIETFIDAAMLLVNDGIKVRFVIVGSGQEAYVDSVKDLIRQDRLQEFIHVYDYREDIASFLSELDILVNASDNEGFSRVVIEAMACGKPVIATRVGGNPEAVNDLETGIMIEPANAHRLKDALQELIEDPQRRRLMGAQAKCRVAEHFTIEKQMNRVHQMYESVFNEKNN